MNWSNTARYVGQPLAEAQIAQPHHHPMDVATASISSNIHNVIYAGRVAIHLPPLRDDHKDLLLTFCHL